MRPYPQLVSGGMSSRQSPRRSARRATTSSATRGVTARPTPRNNPERGSSMPFTTTPSARVAGLPPTTNDIFEIVADGNADMLEEIIDFSGAQHVCELRSQKQEDYGQNLLHCAVTSGQLKTLQVLLKHKVFDPNQVDSVYTRITPMMEAVKIGRLDLIECLIGAGGRLDVQDVNGDSVLHWAAREVSAAFLRQVLYLARQHGNTVPQLVAALKLRNSCGEDAGDVGANEVARESIRRLVSGEETPGLMARRGNSTSLKSGQSGAFKNTERPSFVGKRSSQTGPRPGSASVSRHSLPLIKGRRRPPSAPSAATSAQTAAGTAGAATGVPTEMVARILVRGKEAPEEQALPMEGVNTRGVVPSTAAAASVGRSGSSMAQDQL